VHNYPFFYINVNRILSLLVINPVRCIVSIWGSYHLGNHGTVAAAEGRERIGTATVHEGSNVKKKKKLKLIIMLMIIMMMRSVKWADYHPLGCHPL